MQRTHLPPDQLAAQPTWLVHKWLRFMELERHAGEKDPEAQAAEDEIAKHRQLMGVA
jgi:hypothetical protein